MIEISASTLGDEDRAAIAGAALRIRGVSGREALVESARSVIEVGTPAHHVIELDGDELVGYAQITESAGGCTVEFLGAAPSEGLVEAAVGVAERIGRRPVLWLHGLDAEGSSPLGSDFARDRAILRLCRSTARATTPPIPDGLVLRTFERDRDAATWLALNARSFAVLPDQGSWTESDLELRLDAPWFDPSGFLVLEEDGEMVGFCWTKVHRDSIGAVGEIYVIGVSPDVAGRGLGRLLVEAGIAHLASMGIEQVILYVETDNSAARSLYRRLGFATEWVDERFSYVG